jgi:hypothetical protein
VIRLILDLVGDHGHDIATRAREVVDSLEKVTQRQLVRALRIPVTRVQPGDIDASDDQRRWQSGHAGQDVAVDRERGAGLAAHWFPSAASGHQRVSVELDLGLVDAERLRIRSSFRERAADRAEVLFLHDDGRHVVPVRSVGLVDEGVEHGMTLRVATDAWTLYRA